jgi:hypothetical protein
MGTTTYELEQHIAEQRRELGQNIDELTYRARQATDWRVQFRKRPFAFLGLSFAGGLLLAAAFGGGSRRHSWNNELPGPATRSQKRKALDQWDMVKGALIGVAAKQVKSLLSSTVPHFDQEYRESERKRAQQVHHSEAELTSGL